MAGGHIDKIRHGRGDATGSFTTFDIPAVTRCRNLLHSSTCRANRSVAVVRQPELEAISQRASGDKYRAAVVELQSRTLLG